MTAPVVMSTPEVLESIHGVLSPYVGKLMAKAAAGAHCKELGVAANVITREQVEALIGKLGLGLNVFVGRDKSAQVVTAMRQAVDALGRLR
jgi:hypothetical protein